MGAVENLISLSRRCSGWEMADVAHFGQKTLTAALCINKLCFLCNQQSSAAVSFVHFYHYDSFDLLLFHISKVSLFPHYLRVSTSLDALEEDLYSTCPGGSVQLLSLTSQS